MSHCPSNIPKKYPNLILKHEILSPECDQFRVLSVNSRCFSFSFLALCVGIGIAIYALQVAVSGFTAAACVVLLLAVLVAYLLQPIEERVLIVRSLGIQSTVVNGFHQEFSTFYPFESVASFYIFEAFVGLKVVHSFNLKLKEEGKNIILFENLGPPVEFLKRLYRKIHEVIEQQ